MHIHIDLHTHLFNDIAVVVKLINVGRKDYKLVAVI
jgi:hypothetical protein